MCKRLNKIKRINEQSNEILTRAIENYYKTKSRKQELELLELETSGKPLRSVTTLISDGILTSKQLVPDRGQDLRSKALAEILCSIPLIDYRQLKQMFENDKILIQIPSAKVGGYISRVKRNIDCTLYLSPLLESYKYSYIRNTVAHELSHVLLHSDFSSKNKNIVEKQAEVQALSWGY